MTDQPERYISRYGNARMWQPSEEDKAAIDYALAQYEKNRLASQPQPKFTLENIGNYSARPSRSTIWDMVATSLMAACWMAALFGLYLLIK